MDRILGMIATIAALIGFLLLAMMFYAHVTNGGMAVLGFQSLGALISLLAVVTGAIALFMGRPRPSLFSEIGLGLGLGNLLALLIAILFFG